MAESPTPETGTPESQSPARTPPALITTEELLQSMVAKSPAAATAPFGTTASRSVSPVERYEYLRAADAGHQLQGICLPPEGELRAAVLGGRLAFGPPPRLPHQLSPALQSVLLGWRSVYESCRAGPVLQALVGECYAQEAVFEDTLVSAKGHDAVYRQFAMLGTAVRAVQVTAYSLSVAPLSRPMVLADIPPPATGSSASGPPRSTSKGFSPPPRLLHNPTTSQPPQRVGMQAMESLSWGRGRGQMESQPLRAVGEQPPQESVHQKQLLHLTRVAVENVQSYELGLPHWMSWLVGSEAMRVQVPLYVTSILIVASDAPLAVGASGGGGGVFGGGLEGAGLWSGDLTANRLADAAAVLQRNGGAGDVDMGPLSGLGDGGGGGSSSISCGAAPGHPAWRIVHHVDIWHNVPLVWWRLRRAVCVAMDALLAPLLLRV